LPGRRQLPNDLTAIRDQKVFPPPYFAEVLTQAILQFPDSNSFHNQNVASCGYIVKSCHADYSDSAASDAGESGDGDPRALGNVMCEGSGLPFGHSKSVCCWAGNNVARAAAGNDYTSSRVSLPAPAGYGSFANGGDRSNRPFRGFLPRKTTPRDLCQATVFAKLL
jgi:hypothetical protein